jgi:Cdc6-like AAA superfamily ATPase
MKRWISLSGLILISFLLLSSALGFNSIYFIILIIIFILILIFILIKDFYLYRNKHLVIKDFRNTDSYCEIELLNQNRVLFVKAFKVTLVNENLSKGEMEGLLSTITSFLKNRSENSKDLSIYSVFDSKCNASYIYLISTKKDHLLHEAKIIEDGLISISRNLRIKHFSSFDNLAIPLPRINLNEKAKSILFIPKEENFPFLEALPPYDIPLGIVKNYSKEIECGIANEDLEAHVGIFGSTGSGKTHTAKLLAKAISMKDYIVVILDWHGEYNDLKGFQEINPGESDISIDPLNGGDLEITLDFLEEVLDLSEPQSFIISLVLRKISNKERLNIEELMRSLNSLEASDYWTREVKMALIRKLYNLTRCYRKGLFNSKEDNSNLYDYIKQSKKIIINLNIIQNTRLRRIYALSILKLLYDWLKRDKIKMVVIIDEAHNIFLEKEDPLFTDRLISEIRKFGMSLIVITQSPSQIASSVLSNTNTKIIHSIKNEEDRRVLVNSTGLNNDIAHYLNKLEVGEAIIMGRKYSVPILVNIRKLDN